MDWICGGHGEIIRYGVVERRGLGLGEGTVRTLGIEWWSAGDVDWGGRRSARDSAEEWFCL